MHPTSTLLPTSQLPATQESILQRLKVRGPQSVKILAKQLAITTMGIRQHLAELSNKGFVETTAQTRQPRGRPVHYWQLTARGHEHFPDAHAYVATQLIAVLRQSHGDSALHELIDHSEAQQQNQPCPISRGAGRIHRAGLLPAAAGVYRRVV